MPGLEGLRGEAFEEVLVFGFLPILVFQAVLDLSIRDFFRNLGPILALATVALAISAALVGAALNVVLGVPLVAALLFGTLISATDPVAVVAVFTELGVPKRLLTLVEGESLLNDGVAIVGFNILLVAALGGAVSPLEGVVDFVVVFGGGTVIGVGIGLVAAAVLPWLDRLGAAALSLAVAYGGFVLADHVLGFSGVMATVAAGLVLGGLAPSRASQEVRDMWRELWEALDHIANAVLFLLIGLVWTPRCSVAMWGPSCWRPRRCSSPARSPSCRSLRCSSGSPACRASGAATRRSSCGAGCAAAWRSPWPWPCPSSSPSGSCSSR